MTRRCSKGSLAVRRRQTAPGPHRGWWEQTYQCFGERGFCNVKVSGCRLYERNLSRFRYCFERPGGLMLSCTMYVWERASKETGAAIPQRARLHICPTTPPHCWSRLRERDTAIDCSFMNHRRIDELSVGLL
jgi:hypothetical protein